MAVTKSQKKKENVIQIKRSVYSEDELKEIKTFADRSGARIISTSSATDGARKLVLLELDKTKRQF